jgi:glucose dehydrogenase
VHRYNRPSFASECTTVIVTKEGGKMEETTEGRESFQRAKINLRPIRLWRGKIVMQLTIMAMLLSATVPLLVLAQTADELQHDDKTPGDVLTYGMGYSQQRFSPLAHINRDNVKRLVPAWSYSMADNRGQEAQPLVKDGVIYLTDHEKTVAINALSGKQIWKSMLEYPPDTTRVVCCGIVNRGAALFDGKLYRTTLDAHVIALDITTGKEVWRTKSADPQDGYSMTGAPLVANGVVITGVAGAEFGHRGYLEGLDPQTGKQLWRTYTIPAPGEPGAETWVAAVPGSPGPMIWNSISSFGGLAIPRPGIRSAARATTCIPTRSWPFSPARAKWSGGTR